MPKINSEVPADKNYIKLSKFKELCTLDNDAKNALFSKILRISLRRFFLMEIYNVDIRSVRTTREIRLEQIKTGR